MGNDDDILEFVKRHLKAIGPKRWEPVAIAAGVAKSLPRKIVYDDRDNPGVKKIQPLYTYFKRLERGEISLPAEEGAAPAQPAEAGHQVEAPAAAAADGAPERRHVDRRQGAGAPQDSDMESFPFGIERRSGERRRDRPSAE